ncbi:MAG: NAD-dependent epimerase/dehydratase family protein [bacterium]
MKVLVTGGCGFIGSHVCEYYINKGAQVVSFDSMTKYELGRTGYAVDGARDYNWKFLENLGVKMVKADIRNFSELEEHGNGCDYIVHTAAQPAVTISIEDPDLDIMTNAVGTFNVLKTARKFKIPIVSCATIHVYGNRINQSLKEDEKRYIYDPAEIDETHPIMEGILTPLHASKRSAEIYLQTFIDSYKIQAASYRLTGLYGPRQFGGEDHGWVANFCIRAVLGIPIRIFGTGKQVRDILYATDVAKAFDAFYQTRKSGIYNVGPGLDNSISLLQCIDIIAEILGKRPEVIVEPSRLGDLEYFVCDSTKAKNNLKWKAEISPRKGIKKLIEWVENSKDLFAVDKIR